VAKAVGIDLGTTNSVVAVMEAGKPTVIVNSRALDDSVCSFIHANGRTPRPSIGKTAGSVEYRKICHCQGLRHLDG
jgi:molecular chaperone DnaK (HSP70)